MEFWDDRDGGITTSHSLFNRANSGHILILVIASWNLPFDNLIRTEVNYRDL